MNDGSSTTDIEAVRAGLKLAWSLAWETASDLTQERQRKREHDERLAALDRIELVEAAKGFKAARDARTSTSGMLSGDRLRDELLMQMNERREELFAALGALDA